LFIGYHVTILTFGDGVFSTSAIPELLHKPNKEEGLNVTKFGD